MEQLRVKKVPGFKAAEWTKKPRYAQEADATTCVKSGVQLIDADTGEHVVTFVPFDQPIAPLLTAVRRLQFQENYRTEGLKSRSCTFGYQPRIPLRRDFCSVAASAYKRPAEHSELIRYGEATARAFERLLPREYAQQISMLEAVKPTWKEAGTHFTSGIVNDRNVLHYHRDAGNFPDALSTMLSLTRDMGPTGGKLILPEYAVALEYAGFELTIFNGAKHVHGVTPIMLSSAASYRFTVVYYALAAMARCGTPQEELQRIKKIKTQREEGRTSAKSAALRERLLNSSGMSEAEMAEAAKRSVHFEKRKLRKK